MRYGLQQELGVSASEAQKIVIFGYKAFLAGRIPGTGPFENVVQLEDDEEQPQIASLLDSSHNLNTDVTPLSPNFSGAVVATKTYPEMGSSKKPSLHLLQNAQVHNVNDRNTSNTLIDVATSNGGMSPTSSPPSGFARIGHNCYSADRICTLPSTSESLPRSPMVHPGTLYKYSNDGEYQSNLAIVHSKINTDPYPTPTGTKKKRLLSTMQLHSQLRNGRKGK